MNKIISIVNPKGGVGKSTLCNAVCSLLQLSGKKVTLVDADPQQSSARFSSHLPFDVVYNDISTIKTAILYFQQHSDVVVVDTQGSRDGHMGPRTNNIIELSDLVIIPTPGSALDFDGSIPVLESLRVHWETNDRPIGLLVMNRFDSARPLSQQFRDQIKADWPEFLMSKAEFPLRQTIANLQEAGRPLTSDARVKGVTEILGAELEELLYGK